MSRFTVGPDPLGINHPTWPFPHAGLHLRIGRHSGGSDMARKHHSAEEIVNKLRQADVELGRGSPWPRSAGCWA